MIEDVVVEHLTRTGRDPLSLRGCAFRRVTLRGPISFVLPKPFVRRPQEAKVLPEFWHDNARLYAETDWALDISGAVFGGMVTFEGIPSHLIRRDPSSQFVIPVTAAPQILASHPGTVWALIAQEALDLGVPSIVVATGKRARTFHSDVTALRMLQDQGLAQ